ncbi:sensor histidine kinase [Nocardia sp. NPDC005366]|uniref:sensor histidine kinase n=1 Tax=Nocardia sp. NPDC005366 TaxID=3156878 RepID=UPI0033B580FA
MTVTETSAPSDFSHPALFYNGDDEYLAGLVPFIREGLALGEPVAVAVPEARLRTLREALGTSADGVRWIDMEQAGRNPGRIIATVLRAFADDHPDSHVRIIGEPIWPGRNAMEYPACAQHEALINPAFAGRDVTIVCPYDLAGLDAEVIADAHATHPVLWEKGDHRRMSRDYDPDAVVEHYNRPIPAPADAVELTVSESADMAGARRWAAEQGRRFGLNAERQGDLELIVTELATNSLCHGAGPSRVRLWTDDTYLICEVHDVGRLDDPLAGRRPASAGVPGGRGLLLVHQLCDLVRTHTTGHGTTQYAMMALTPAERSVAHGLLAQ